MGSGRSETIRAMFGLDARAEGRVSLNTDGELKQVSSTKLLEKSGYVTENRHKDGLFPHAAAVEKQFRGKLAAVCK